jgi:hypothetical protein
MAIDDKRSKRKIIIFLRKRRAQAFPAAGRGAQVRSSLDGGTLVPDRGNFAPCTDPVTDARLGACRGSCIAARPDATPPGLMFCSRCRPSRGSLVLTRSTGMPPGRRDAPAAARPTRWSSRCFLRPPVGRIRRTCCCAGITAGCPGRLSLQRERRSWIWMACRLPTVFGRRNALTDKAVGECGAVWLTANRPRTTSEPGGNRARRWKCLARPPCVPRRGGLRTEAYFPSRAHRPAWAGPPWPGTAGQDRRRPVAPASRAGKTCETISLRRNCPDQVMGVAFQPLSLLEFLTGSRSGSPACPTGIFSLSTYIL